MVDTPGDLVWDLPCVQQASYMEGGPLMWMLPVYLHVIQKSGDDDNHVNINLKEILVYLNNQPKIKWNFKQFFFFF